MTSSNGNISALLALCAENSPVTGEFHSQRPVTRSFDDFFDMRLNTNDWVNNRDTGDLRRYRAHYDVIAMQPFLIENNETITPRCPYFQGMFRPLFWRDQDNFLNEIIWNLRWFSSIFIMNTELYDCRKTQNTLEPHSIKNTAL